MKKIALLFAILCVGALSGMKRIKPKPELEYGHYVGWGNLLPELKALIITYLNTYDNPDDIVNAIKATSKTNKELNQMVNEKYGNLSGFTALVHTLAKKFNRSTESIAEEFKTPTAKQYIQLNDDLLTTVITGTIDEVTQLINQGADVNYGKAYKIIQGRIFIDADYYDAWTPLYYAVMYSYHDKVKLLLTAGAIPRSDNYYCWTKDKNSADQMKQLLDEAREKQQ